MVRVLWGSALLLAVLVFFYVAGNAGNPPMLLNPSEPLVDKGVAMVMVCGEQPHRETVNRTAAAVLNESRWAFGWWSYHRLHYRQGNCRVYYQHPRWGD